MRRFLSAVIASFVILSVALYLVDYVFLVEEYERVIGVYREEVMWLPMLIGQLIFSIGFVYIYSQQIKEKTWYSQGFAYGIAFWVVFGLALAFINYSIYPFEIALVVKEAVSFLITLVIMALAIAYIYRVSLK